MTDQLQQYQIREFVLYLKSDDNINIYPQNKFNLFTCLLPFRHKLVQIEKYYWQVAVLDIFLTNAKKGTFLKIPQSCILLCNLVEANTVICRTQRAVIRHILADSDALSDSSGAVIYHTLEHQSFQEILFELVDFNLDKLKLSLWEDLIEPGDKLTLSLVLHFQIVSCI